MTALFVEKIAVLPPLDITNIGCVARADLGRKLYTCRVTSTHHVCHLAITRR